MEEQESATAPVQRKLAPTLDDAEIDRARELIGVWLRRDIHMRSRFEPISPHDIRRWAHYSVGDDNPLWSDSEHGMHSGWGSNIAPPTFLYTIDSGVIAPRLRGIQWIFAGGEWQNFHPVRPGDTVTAGARLIDVQIKTGTTVPRFVNQVGEVIFTNQHQQVVSRYESNIFRIPRRRSGEGMRYLKEDKEKPRPHHYTDEEIEEVAHAYANEERRGPEPRYWEDVEVGTELPVLFKGPLTLVDIIGFYAGRRTVYNVLKLAFLERQKHPANVYVSPSTNIPMHPAAGHFDAEIAHEIGMPGAYDQGWQRMGWGAHLLTNWSGDHAFVRRFSGRVTRPNLVGDLTRLTGRVTSKTKQAGEALVEIEWWGTNQRGERNCNGSAGVRLPSRDIEVKQ